jgi:hypothetical protein
MKLAHTFAAFAFAVGCTGLWMAMRALVMLHGAHPLPETGAGGGKLAHGDFEIFCVTHAWLLPFFGVPAIAYAIWVSVRGRASVEGFCLFAAVLSFVFVALLSTVALACMVSWIPLYD